MASEPNPRPRDPAPASPSKPPLMGALLVALQLGLIALLLWHALAAARQRPIPPEAWALAGLGFALGAWALSANRPGNFNIRPHPRRDGVLVQSGPYRWIRHPMYSALLLFGAAALSLQVDLVSVAGFVGLAAVLALKAAIEERAMAAAHPDYAAYRRRTSRFVPGIF